MQNTLIQGEGSRASWGCVPPAGGGRGTAEPAVPPIEAGLHLFTSNRMEILAGKLAERLGAPLPRPLQAEIVVVRNRGMERWLKLELATRHGICANCQFPFPEAFGQRIFRELIPEVAQPSPLSREILSWRILKVLPGLLERSEFAPLRHYLGRDPDARKAAPLASRIADLFDRYVIFRPAMVLAWEQGREETEPERWQAALWRAVSGNAAASHAAALWQRFRQIVDSAPLPPTDLPPRLSLFGISALPPFYLDLFAGLSRHLQINLFLLQPSREYWGDIISAREQERMLRTTREEADAFQLHLETGNRLLASLGYLGRDFLKLVLDAGDWVTDEAFVEPGEDTLLHCIQSDILDLRERDARTSAPAAGQMPTAGKAQATGADSTNGAAGQPIEPSDDSIQIHCCHSPLRELEVLYDHMLDWLQQDPALTPRDIVVMTPDIEAYAPLVQAVFGAAETPARFIPFSVADRAGRRQSQVIETFLRLLRLPETRMGAATVLEILETPAVRGRFGLRDPDLEWVRGWVEETNICWGIDGEHRRQFDLPALPGNTWRHGLDRLLLGYGMRGEGTRLFQGILPYDDLEGEQARVLGQFLAFIDQLIECTRDLRNARPLQEWSQRLQRLIDAFFQPSESTAYELQILRNTLAELRRQQVLSESERPVELSILLDHLTLSLDQDVQHAGYLTGGVTFCGLKPMRSIPFRIICLLGMNDGAFPRPTTHLGFDLMIRKPRLGDRSTREDDRYLFLETLLSARQRFYLSYVGQNIRDNSTAPPSVLISELMDYVAQGFSDGDRNLLEAQIVTPHRLQAFSQEYFKPGGRLFSYSQDNAQASDFIAKARSPLPPFCAGDLGEAASQFREVTLERLVSFLANPAKFFLIYRLDVNLWEDATEVEEREPFVLDALEDHRMKQLLVEQRLNTAAPPGSDPHHWLEAAGHLPLGSVGTAECQRLVAGTTRFLALLSRHRPATPLPPVDIDVMLEAFHVTGRISERTSRGPLYFRCARLKPRDLLQAWVLHLAANLDAPGQQTTLITEEGARTFRPPTDTRALLQDLLAVYWRGLRAPLKFFPATALAFLDAEGRKPERSNPEGTDPAEERALLKARKAWEGSETPPVPGERENPYIATCFRDVDPLDAEFTALAREILEPLRAHLEKEKAEA